MRSHLGLEKVRFGAYRIDAGNLYLLDYYFTVDRCFSLVWSDGYDEDKIVDESEPSSQVPDLEKEQEQTAPGLARNPTDIGKSSFSRNPDGCLVLMGPIFVTHRTTSGRRGSQCFSTCSGSSFGYQR